MELLDSLPLWAQLLFGPVGLLAGLVAFAYGVYTGRIFFGAEGEAKDKRADKAEEESDSYVRELREKDRAYADDLRAKDTAIADLRVELATVRSELRHANEKLNMLEGKTDRNARILGEIQREIGEGQ